MPAKSLPALEAPEKEVRPLLYSIKIRVPLAFPPPEICYKPPAVFQSVEKQFPCFAAITLGHWFGEIYMRPNAFQFHFNRENSQLE